MGIHRLLSFFKGYITTACDITLPNNKQYYGSDLDTPQILVDSDLKVYYGVIVWRKTTCKDCLGTLK